MMRAFHIAWKDVRVWLRDVAALGVLLGMPVVLIFILGSALGGTTDGDITIHVGVVNLDEGYDASSRLPSRPGAEAPAERFLLGDELTDLLTTDERLTEIFTVEELDDAEEAREQVAAGDLAAALVIPPSYSEDVFMTEPVKLAVYKDPGQEVAAGILESVVRSLAAQYAAASVAVQTVQAVGVEAGGFAASATRDPTIWPMLQGIAISRATAEGALETVAVDEQTAAPDIELRAIDFFGLSMTSMFLMFGAMFGAFATIKERREQTLSRLLATPTSALSVTGGKMLGIWVLGMAQFTVLYVFTRFLFGVQWGDDVFAIYVIAAAEMLAVTGLALLIASIAKTERGAGGIGPLVIQIQALIGGAFFTITVLPQWLQPIRYFSVVGWTMEGWSAVQMNGAGVGDVLGPIGALLGLATVFFAIGSLLMGRRG